MEPPLTVEDVRAKSDEELVALEAELNRLWKMLDRKADPRGEYSARQSVISSELELIRQVRSERAAS